MNNRISTIIKAGLIVGTLDILSAFIHSFIKTGKPNILLILRFIASGIFGKAAFTGGNLMVLSGLILHYMIAFLFTIFFFWLYPRIKALSKNKILTAILYGIFIWIVMNLIVVPLSHIAYRQPTVSNIIINTAILIICIGIPLSWMAAAFYKKDRAGYKQG